MLVKDEALFAKYLKEHPVQKLFSADILPYLELHVYKKGDFLSKEFSPPTYLRFLVEGNVKIYMTLKNGKINIMELLSGWGIIGELEMLNAQNTTQAVQAMGNVWCFELPLARCNAFALKDVCFLRELCRMLGEKIVRNRDVFTVNQSYPLENRLASYILMTTDGGLFDERLTEVAEYLGTSYRHLLRTLSNLCARGILKREERGYAVIKAAYLSRLAQEID